MAADSDGCDLTTIVTCEGNLSDPAFAKRFSGVVDELNGLLGDVVKVHKLEPWNSVRVTLSIPREAALRLRKLASEGSAQLRALGILSIQVEGDQVISLRIANSHNAEPQEIRLQTTQDGSGSSQVEGPLSLFLGAPPPDPPEKVQFKSPNVVCPPDSVVPKVPVSAASASNSTTPPASKSFGGPFPFTSMNQAIHSQATYTAPPPPYPGNKLSTTISSPLLVNLLQNDGAPPPKQPSESVANSAVKSNANRTSNSFVQKPRTTVANRTKNTKASTSPPPSALSNTSIRQNSKPNSTIASVTLPAYTPSVPHLPPPPPYTVAVTRPWDSVVQTTPFLDLTPSLTDLKADDLEHLLPTLERDLARSPPEIPEELTRSEDKRKFLINPLTGELEPQSSGESDPEDHLGDVFTGLPSPAALSDEDTNSTIRPDTTDQSDSETRSSHSDSGKHPRIKTKAVRDRGRDSPGLKPTEKIKLRLKLEKSEPISSAYKVDVSFIQQQPKKAAVASEELRVPPLHISLRGRHHAFITNKKKKLNPDKPKMRKTQDLSKTKKNLDPTSAINDDTSDEKKAKKFKSNHEHDDLISKLVMHNYKEKQKERRGSDSELSRANLKFVDSNGIISVEKKRRLSQSEPGLELDAPVLGSTNVGTIAGLPQKPRKDKSKVKDVFKASKETMRSKSFAKNLTKQVVLPTGEIDMEAKFKQRLMEGTEKGIPRPPHRTAEGVVGKHQIVTENNQIEKSDQVIKVDTEPPPLKDKSPEPDKCNTPDRNKQPDLGDKQAGRSPNSGAQGEDSGIESMDALSEKSPNQASQSPHDADIPEPTIKSKTQVPDMPDMLDIEAQLAKMEGLNGVEDMNENQHRNQPKQLGQCCELTSALQDSLKQGAVSLSSVNATSPLAVKDQHQPADVTLVPVKSKTKEADLEPLPVRVTPPLYTYSNPDKGRSSASPPLSDDDSNSCASAAATTAVGHKAKSLLEQLLIEIPDGGQPPSSPSPAARSVRTRALSKLGSPELGPAPKRRRRASDSSSGAGAEDAARAKKTRKCSENAAELIKACMGVEAAMKGAKKEKGGKVQDESSDSDEPLIEKVRKTTTTTTQGGKKVKKGAVSTRRSVRTTPAPNTRSKGDKEAEALRRKTRSAVSESDNKRKKEVK